MARKTTPTVQPTAHVAAYLAQAATTPAPTVVAQPVAPTAAAPAPSATYSPSAAYTISSKVQVITARATLQRGCTVPVGANWRSNGHTAPNTRHIAINALMAAASDGTLTHAAAVAALQPLHKQAILGSGTPASYIRAFVKCGYLVPVTGAA